MKTGCIHYDECRLTAQACNWNCEKYQPVRGWQEELIDIANREYYEREARDEKNSCCCQD